MSLPIVIARELTLRTVSLPITSFIAPVGAWSDVYDPSHEPMSAFAESGVVAFARLRRRRRADRDREKKRHAEHSGRDIDKTAGSDLHVCDPREKV